MRTDPRNLHDTSADLLVIGAGIQGAAIARDAAMRGLSVVLCDARDFGAGTSSRSSRLVHGGLRYLRDAQFALVREALVERERLLRQVPHLVRPLPMLMPFFRERGADAIEFAPFGEPVVRSAPSPRWLMWFGTKLYRKLAGRSTLPGPRLVRAADAVRAFPGLRTNGLKSALEFFDAATRDTELTLANVMAAAQAGARVVNHCGFLGVDRRGARLLDRITGDEVHLATKNVINAAGPAVDGTRRVAGLDGDPLVRLTRGSHVILPERAGETALTAFLPDGRIQFVIPHAGGTICGTTDVDDQLDGDETGPPAADLDYLQAALGWLLEPAPGPNDLEFAYAGWRALPAVEGPAGGVSREAFTVTEPIACGDLHTVVGGKLTTHRAFAERTVASLFGQPRRSPTRTVALPGGDGPREFDDPLWWRLGALASRVWDIAARDRMLAEPLCPHRPFLAAEVLYAAAETGVVKLADLLLRRLVDPRGPCLERSCLHRAHALFSRVAEHDRGADEIVEVEAEAEVMRGALDSWRGAVAAD